MMNKLLMLLFFIGTVNLVYASDSTDDADLKVLHKDITNAIVALDQDWLDACLHRIPLEKLQNLKSDANKSTLLHVAEKLEMSML